MGPIPLRQNYSCALNEFHPILQEEPDSAAAHILSGEALDGLDRTPEAISEFEAAARVSPREPDVRFGLGYLHWKLLQFDRAKDEFEIGRKAGSFLPYLVAGKSLAPNEQTSKVEVRGRLDG